MVINIVFINALGLLATALSILMWIPQARSTWQNRNDPMRLAAISETTQWLLMACYVIWGAFGLLSGSFWVAAPSVVAFPLALATVIVVRRGRRLPTAIGTDATVSDLDSMPITQSIPIFYNGAAAEAGEPVRDLFPSTGAIPILP